MIDCTVHLLSLDSSLSPKDAATLLSNSLSTPTTTNPLLVTGIPHGWIHKPHVQDAALLLAHDWHLFALTSPPPNTPLNLTATNNSILAHATIAISIPETQYTALRTTRTSPPTPLPTTPPLPAAWHNPQPNTLSIPPSAIAPKTPKTTNTKRPAPGTLNLDSQMASFLSSLLPSPASQKPISLFNLFQYARADSTAHDAYMARFKSTFGDSAGARVKFMGPVKSPLSLSVSPPSSSEGEGRNQAARGQGWQDANLVQYDSIWHYAWMLSTGEYAELNRGKVEGLADTGILGVGEWEVWGL